MKSELGRRIDGCNLRRKLTVDAGSESVVNDPQADKLLTRNYRAPFTVPEKV